MYKNILFAFFVLCFINLNCKKKEVKPELEVPEEEKVERRREVIGAVIDRDAEFEGIIDTDGDLTIAGKVKGTIIARGVVVIEEGAYVECDSLVATEVEINGHVKGFVVAVGTITVNETGILEGEHEQKELIVNGGAILDSKSRMGGYKEVPTRR